MANFCQTCGAQASAGRFCASCGAQRAMRGRAMGGRAMGGLAMGGSLSALRSQISITNQHQHHAQEVIDPNTSDVDWTVCLLLNLFLGLLGVHRFYSGHIVIGFIQLMTGGMCGIWTIVDLILIVSGTYTDAQGRPLKR